VAQAKLVQPGNCARQTYGNEQVIVPGASLLGRKIGPDLGADIPVKLAQVVG